MDNENKGINLSQKAKRPIVSKFTLQLASLLIVIGLVVIFSLINLGFDNSVFKDPMKFTMFVVNIITNITLGLYGLSMGESFSKDQHMKDTKSLYQADLEVYVQTRDKIEDLYTAFEQWLIEKAKVEAKDKKLKALSSVNIHQKFILDVLDQIKEPKQLLLEPLKVKVDGKEEIIKIMNKEQVKMIIKLKEGKIKHHVEPASYYFTQHEMENGSFLLDEAYTLKTNEMKVAIKARLQKGVMTLMFGMATAVITFSQVVEPNLAQLFFNIVSKLGTICMAMLGGYKTGIEIVKYKSVILENKVLAMKEFKKDYDAKTFIPLDDSEIAKKQLKEETITPTIITNEITEMGVNENGN